MSIMMAKHAWIPKMEASFSAKNVHLFVSEDNDSVITKD